MCLPQKISNTLIPQKTFLGHLVAPLTDPLSKKSYGYIVTDTKKAWNSYTNPQPAAPTVPWTGKDYSKPDPVTPVTVMDPTSTTGLLLKKTSTLRTTVNTGLQSPTSEAGLA